MPGEDQFGPWNPGLNSTIPKHLMDRVTLYDPAHASVSWDKAKALSEMTGLKPHELALPRPERLALHSVLIRVSSQLYVPDGPNYADFGITLRDMADEIYRRFVMPEIEVVTNAYEGVRQEALREVAALLGDRIYVAAKPVQQPGFWARLTGKAPAQPVSLPDRTALALDATHRWKDERNEDVPTASRRAIARLMGAHLNRRGALVLDQETAQEVAVGLVLNRLGSAAVGEVVQEIFERAVDTLGHHRLPAQSEPMVLNAKGASASGKSTIRPQQRQIAEGLGYDWRDFAVISPDYWRKALIDYDGLGKDHKYAAMLCGQELEVIDRKLDILMAVHGNEGRVPHMLIDRFRFDSFHADRTWAEDSTLLTRFGAKVFLFFLVTPPEATVERAWSRGVETGRYKAVDDLLFHNIEAYTGMPDLFFRWARDQDKWVQYEFLDNSVAKDQRPRAIAFGQNGHLVVKDLDRLCDITRFADINVDAKSSAEIFSKSADPKTEMGFLRGAMAALASVDVLAPGTETVFARSREGKITVDPKQLPDGFDPGCLGSHELSEDPLGPPEFSEIDGLVGY